MAPAQSKEAGLGNQPIVTGIRVMVTPVPGKEAGLGNQAILAKIDKLRELNIGANIPLPQLVVVGDQSSGKSSVLESLTGFSFPRAVNLCTRYATQITCCRDSTESVTISIIARPGADEKLKKKLSAFRRQIVGPLGHDQLAGVFKAANITMGIRMSTEDERPNARAFSEDILKIEVNGPEQSHLTVIDVPGIFRVPTPGLTTESDIALVENMVKAYMSNRRTIILAVLPCNVDMATQEILKLAEAADPDGSRTMGVLTKPDLATENATRQAVIDSLNGKKTNLKLGYYVVKNRSADDESSSLTTRAAAEQDFFRRQPWLSVQGRCGVVALKNRLRQLLMQISNKEFPHVKAEINQRLRSCVTDLELMGPARSDPNAQRLYLGKVANKFQNIAQCALDARYRGEPLFDKDIRLRLSTHIIHLQIAFTETFLDRGHMEEFCSISSNNDSTASNTTVTGTEIDSRDSAALVEPPLAKYVELGDIIEAFAYDCPDVEKTPIIERIKEIFNSCRGPDLGSSGTTVLATVFEHQTQKWESLTLSHISQVIALVHDFIYQLVSTLCPDETVRARLWEGFLVNKLCDLYRKAMDHARFLLSIERCSRPATFNQHFNRVLQENRNSRLTAQLNDIGFEMKDQYSRNERVVVPMDRIKSSTVNRSNDEQVHEDIADMLESYYKVSQQRFIDVLYQQVVSHAMLEGPDSPVRVFGPDMILQLDEGQLEMIAGEDEDSKQQRAALETEIDNLKAALKVL